MLPQCPRPSRPGLGGGGARESMCLLTACRAELSRAGLALGIGGALGQLALRWGSFWGSFRSFWGSSGGALGQLWGSSGGALGARGVLQCLVSDVCATCRRLAQRHFWRGLLRAACCGAASKMAARRTVAGVSLLESPDPGRVMRFLVEADAGGVGRAGGTAAEFSAVVTYPRMLIDKCSALQPEELALVVFYTAGAPKHRDANGERRVDGMRWGHLLGCGPAQLGVLDRIVQSHSPQLTITESVFWHIYEAVKECKKGNCAMRPQLEGGMQWCPADLGS